MLNPAILGGAPAFAELLPIARPFIPPLDRVMERLRPSYERGQLTNGPLVKELEQRIAERLSVPHVVAVASCTAGLMLVLRNIGGKGPAVLPSFTFSASAHSVAWTGAAPVFCECDPDTFQIDVADAARKAAESGATTLLATHVFGAPAPVEALEALARELDVSLVFDAAHGLGATRAGRAIGSFGDAEIFSLSPTKPLVAGEGGIVATRREDVAVAVRIGRDYGNPGDYDTQFVGLNARMSELHAALALESLVLLDDHLALRRALATQYQAGLGDVPGIAVQAVEAGDVPTFKDFTIAVDSDSYGVDRDTLVAALRADGIDTRRYFSPPVHRQHAYRENAPASLPVTDAVASRVLSLPMFGALAAADVHRVCEVMAAIHAHADEISARAA